MEFFNFLTFPAPLLLLFLFYLFAFFAVVGFFQQQTLKKKAKLVL
jgi:hypothetical protein